ncbi:hypothetical protein B0J11DRAFT_517250 [Dendryphion nanum]|uniref:Sm domain-containing protein n=1 Tax=Dendryphion nanum TaxID=256645 RepID=A0A9P9ECJ3_9PLEO|nr:hypothetical protein B0J11DRAFT_517250 [Dendryphion nanum]
MDKAAATSYLAQFIGKQLRIHTTDARIFGGQMKCTDKDLNIILALTYEYRAPPSSVIKETVESSGKSSANVTWSSRYVGLVVVPGKYVTKIEFEESRMVKSSVVV